MLCVETVAVYCENTTEHTDTLCGQNVEFLYVKVGGTHSYHWAIKGYQRCTYGSAASHGQKHSYFIYVLIRIYGDEDAFRRKQMPRTSIHTVLPFP
jgi:hypothetical protein